ncbi:hypothetical protein PPTG_23321 [Phytophthora nicotianae INRA-310]|uniref:Uncharacterized protein n=1 Tax=Phytophthora nicotianae (strain INRA-310) TaxID=761204 RepID=W2Q2V4_PHYN3|nr:hypothetical protein PPTG_23321 [Phytophthora nicotianae INRA-310]ETN06615.1 hypothetical protein PPTG_23321 [Phytophthora nicotianae INRA-310]
MNSGNPAMLASGMSQGLSVLMSMRTLGATVSDCTSSDKAQFMNSLAAAGCLAFAKMAARWPHAMYSVLLPTGALPPISVPMPITFSPAATNSAATFDPRWKATLWLASLATQSQPYSST